MRRFLAVLTLLLAGFNAAAYAQFRTLPATAKRGSITGNEYPFVQIGSTAFRLAPGAVIWDQNNRTVTPNFLPVGADIVYTVDSAGNIARIYILSPQEQDKLAR